MSEQDRYIPGVPCWVDTTQPDPDAAAAFYAELFGWELENAMPEGSPKYYIARLGGKDVAAVSALPPGAPESAAWNTYVWVDSADETADKARAAGGSVLMEPGDVGDAGRMAVFADPGGAAFSVWQAKRHRGAGLVNEPGSLNFNNLHTRDVEGARAFYGAVFGWELLGVGGAFSSWALPAYGDFLEERTPGMRENMRTMGAPDRFEEVVASVVPIPDDQPDTFPHWGVTFAVEDADEIAARADKLGGWVVVPPFDAPWVRTTVISDPQGATFTASKFVPENKDLSQSGASAANAQ
jgi:predicted enzyme related to lactoylglutathione lyase